MVKHRTIIVGVMGLLAVVFADTAWRAPFHHFGAEDSVAANLIGSTNVHQNVGNIVIDQSDEPNNLLTDEPGTITASGIIVKTPPASIF